MGNLPNVSFNAVSPDTDARFSFVAAALAMGFKMADHTPGLSNVYSTDRKYEPGEPGDLRYYLTIANNQISLDQLGETWVNPRQALVDADALVDRIQMAKDADELQSLVTSFDTLYQKAAVGHMRFMAKGQLSMPDADLNPSDQEKSALQSLDRFRLTLEQIRTPKDRKAAIKILLRDWKPAMIGWLRAFKGHHLELKNLWHDAPAAIKIERPNSKFPLVIPKGPKFNEMLQRWT